MISPEELLAQAEHLLSSKLDAKPTEADVRRAISTAYYAVFHHIAAAAADEFVGTGKRKTARYVRVYRSIDHGTLRSLCDRFRNQSVMHLMPFFPANECGTYLPKFATALVELEEKRKQADYDPSYRAGLSDARKVVQQAREAIRWFENVKPLRRNTFLVLLCFPDRKR